MAITNTTGSATISTTEFFMMSNSTTQTPQTTACVAQPMIDVSQLAAGDQYVFHFYEKVNGTQFDLCAPITVTGAQPGPVVFPAFEVLEGWEVSGKKLAGTDRIIKWAIRKSA